MTVAARLTPYGLRCEHRRTPLGVGEPRPLLSWRLTSALAGDDPVAYELRVGIRPSGGIDDPEIGEPSNGQAPEAGESSDSEIPQTGDSSNGRIPQTGESSNGEAGDWSSGRVEDPAAIGAVYGGPPLLPRTRYGWRVTVWAQDGSAGSAESWFETGQDLWQASWIAHDPGAVEHVDPPTEGDQALSDHGLLPCPQLRTSFASTAVRSARLYVSAKGLYEARVNGHRAGDAELAPGWTDYRRRIQYQVHDVTPFLLDGENVLAVTLADGWWSGFTGFDPRHPGYHYGRFPELIAELHLTFEDGSTRVVATGEDWRTGHGRIRYGDLLKGECHDARAETPGWDLPGFDDSSWRPAVVTGDDHSLLVASRDEPVRALGELLPVSSTPVRPGVHLVDFGQNIAGRVRLTVRNREPGLRVTVRHGEKLDGDDRLHTANLRTADATDVLITAGGAEEVFEPRFTYHGFRYAEVSGLDRLDDIRAIVLHSDTPQAGTFECSDPEINRLYENIVWGQRGNFVSVPTDCPQRDERLGWLADAQVFLPTACFNADVSGFFSKWMRDVVDAQSPEGGFSNVAPLLSGVADEGAPGWADAGTLIPWHLYRTYGDERFLDVDAMTRWVDFVARHNPDLIWRHRTGPHFADWLSPGPATPREVLATAFFHRSTALTAEAARVRGRHDEAERLGALATRIREAFTAEFVGEGGLVEGDTQTGYLLALAFGLLTPEQGRDAAARLAALVEESGPLTGFLGVNLLCPVLSAHGRDDLAHALLRRTDPPSWLYQVQRGATTVWERWDGVGAASMNSFNHYAFGSIGEWLYSGVAGIDQAPGSVAYRELVIRPLPGELSSARASYESARGLISVSWRSDDGGFRLQAHIPPGATATVHLPGGDIRRVTSGDHIFELVRGEKA